MINDIKQSIFNKLLEIYPNGYTYYDEEIPQDYIKPSFLLTLTKQEYKKRLNNKYSSLVSFELTYYSNKSIEEIKLDCQRVHTDILRGFDFVGTYKVLDKVPLITDNVLHFSFNIKYSEVLNEAFIPMQLQQTNTIM